MPTYTPTQAAINLVNLVATNLAGTTNAATIGYDNLLNATVVPHPPFRATADAYFSAVGYQAQVDNAVIDSATSNSTSISVIGDQITTGFSPSSFTIPITKTYLVHVNLSCYVTGSVGWANFRVAIDGSEPAGQPTSSQHFYFNTVSEHTRISFFVPIAFTSGSRTVTARWAVQTADTIISVNSDDFLCFTLMG